MKIMSKKLSEVWEEDPVDTLEVYQHALTSLDKLDNRFLASVRELADYLDASSDAFIMLAPSISKKPAPRPSAQEINQIGVSRAITNLVSAQDTSITVSVNIPTYILLDWMEMRFLPTFKVTQFPIASLLIDLARRSGLEPKKVSQGTDRFYKMTVSNSADKSSGAFETDRAAKMKKDIAKIEFFFGRGPLSIHRSASNLGVDFIPNQGEKFMVNPEELLMTSYNLEQIVSQHRLFNDFIGFLKDEVSEEESEQLQDYKGAY